MKVLMTIDSAGGVFSHAVELIAALHPHDVDVVVVGFGRTLDPDQRERLGRARPAVISETGLALEWTPEPWNDLRRAGELLAEIEQRERPDLIHANAYFAGALDTQAPVLVAAHSCVRSWWRAVHHAAAPAAWDRYGELVADGLAGADAIVAPSHAMAQALAAEYGVRRDIRVIYNGAGVAGPRPAIKAPYALAAGRMWDEAKNLATLTAAAEMMRHPVLIAGELAPGAQAQPVPEAPALAPPGAAHLLGQLPAGELAGLRRAAAVFAGPARYEPFGLANLEAAQDGCALVLADIPSLRELWDGAAVFVAPDDAGALAREVDRLLDQPARAVSLGRVAQRHAERYSTAAMARGYAELYRALARTPERVSP